MVTNKSFTENMFIVDESGGPFMQEPVLYDDDVLDTLDSIKLYKQDMKDIPLLTKQDEVEIGRRAEKSIVLDTSGPIIVSLFRNLVEFPVIGEALTSICHKRISLHELADPDTSIIYGLYNADLCNLIATKLEIPAKESVKHIRSITTSIECLPPMLMDIFGNRTLQEIAFVLETEETLELLQSLNDPFDKHFKDLQLDAKQAKEKLFVSNLRLVLKIAGKFDYNSFAFPDRVQEGNIGLLTAVNRFDFRKGYKFSTYATWWIRQAVTRAFADKSRMIRVPVHVHDNYQKIKHMKETLWLEGYEPSSEDIAAKLNLPVKTVNTVTTAVQEIASLDVPLYNPNNPDGDLETDLAATIPSPFNEPAETVGSAIMKETVQQVINDLPPREGKVIELRFGLYDGVPHTLAEVGYEFGVTRERIRQIEAKALKRLQKPEIKEKLKGLL